MGPPMLIVTWCPLNVIFSIVAERMNEMKHVLLFAATKDCLFEEKLENSIKWLTRYQGVLVESVTNAVSQSAN